MVYILDVFLREKDLHTTIMKIERYFILLILVIPVLILRDFTPNNELKYLSIVDEALRDGHFFTFYHQGELYADKPPLYFWLLMLSKWIWGEYNMFGLSLFSIIPALISVYVMNKWVEEETTTSLRWNGSLMLFTSAFFIGSGLVLRMDMLMCMFILLALYTFYKRYAGKGKPRDRFLLPFYIFMAIFSKGPIGFIVPLITMLVFLLVKRDVRSFCRYFGWREWGILSGFCAIWFLGIYLEGGSTYLNNLLFHQTINRAIDSFDHKKAFWYYGVTFWYSVAPWSILYITTIVIAIKKKLLTTDKEKLFLSAIASTFVILSMFSGKLDIYMLPLFPFFTYLTILLLPKIKEKWIAFSVYIPVTALTIAPIVAFFIRNKFNVPNSPFIYVAIITLFIFSLTACYLLYRKQTYRAINCAALGILATLFTGAFALPQINPYIGFTAMAKEAYHICEEENIDHYYYYKFRSGENMDVYLEEEAIKVTNEDSLFNIYQKGDCMIFVKEKNVTRSPALANWIQQTHHEKIGNFYLIHSDTN